jgi:hypothetical protein
MPSTIDKSTFLALVEIMAGRPLMTRKDLALRYGKDLDTIDRWRREGKLPPGIYLPGCRFPYFRPFEILTFETRRHAKQKKQ